MDNDPVSKQSSGQRSTEAYNQAVEIISDLAAHAGDTYSDLSGTLFSMYLSREENHDKDRNAQKVGKRMQMAS